MVELRYCQKCGTYYTYSDVFYNDVKEHCDKEGYYQGIVVCECGARVIAGGEVVICRGTGKMSIKYFSLSYDHEKNSGFTKYSVDVLVPCQKHHPNKIATTYTPREGSEFMQSLYLRPKTVEDVIPYSVESEIDKEAYQRFITDNDMYCSSTKVLGDKLLLVGWRYTSNKHIEAVVFVTTKQFDIISVYTDNVGEKYRLIDCCVVGDTIWCVGNHIGYVNTKDNNGVKVRFVDLIQFDQDLNVLSIWRKEMSELFNYIHISSFDDQIVLSNFPANPLSEYFYKQQ